MSSRNSPFIHLTGAGNRNARSAAAPAAPTKTAKPVKAAAPSPEKALARFAHLRPAAPAASPTDARTAPAKDDPAALAAKIVKAGRKALGLVPCKPKAPDLNTEAGLLAAAVIAAGKKGVR